jgi:hypothetical protein
MITDLDRYSKLTGGLIPSWMTDQLGAQLRDLAGKKLPPDKNPWRAT